jgi:hypothetical protein
MKGSKSDGPRNGYRFLDLGSGNEVTLYPTIVSMICPAAMRETHFIDAWDQGRNVARMKSFEKGHAMSDPGVPGAVWVAAGQRRSSDVSPMIGTGLRRAVRSLLY